MERRSDLRDPTDTLTTAILEQIGSLGYVVDHEHHDGHVIRATSPTGETWTVRAADAYSAACERSVLIRACRRIS